MWRLNHRRMLLNKVIFILLNQLMIIGIYGKLCEVETGQNNIILDIEETRGKNVINLDNSPVLPIHGDVEDEITLKLNFPEERNNIFRLNGKVLQLIRPLDRDKDNLSHIQFSISCTINLTPSRSRNIPIIVRVTDVNDESPEFINTPYEVSIDEATSVGTTIFSDIKAIDMDAGVNGAVEYFIIQGKTKNLSSEKFSADGFETFSITYHHQGHITLSKSLDYERIQRYYLTVVASDRARNLSERLSATTTLTINIRDSDDLDPTFIYKDCLFFEGTCINPEYYADIIPGTIQKKMIIFPEAIRAIDQDALNASIRYTFVDGSPQSFNEYFEIDAVTAKIRQLKLIDSSVFTERQFVITVKAEEMTDLKRYAIAKLKISVKAANEFPPIVNASDIFGFVQENSPIGTRVLSSKNKFPIKVDVLHKDSETAVDELPVYAFDLTSSLLAVKDGYLIVNDSQIDREKSDKILVQVVAREIHGNAASAPLTLSITVLDMNDNSPEIFEMQPVTIAAGNRKRFLTQAIAKDIDVGKNSIIKFSFSKINSKFSIDSKSGDIYAVGLLNANEQYNLTVKADDGNLFSETSLIVYVVAGLNTMPPVFRKSIYQIQVNESTPINSTLINVQAEDPENDAIKYSISSGNELKHFEISHENGTICIIKKLDRETLSKYQLKIKAEDEDGLFSMANVNIQVTDENDNSPVFDEGSLPYIFSVDEEKSNAFVGSVQAHDSDDGENGEISYSIPADVPFKINKETGEIYTKEKLKFQAKSEYEFLIRATDRGKPFPLSSEIRIKIIVKDNPTVLPAFEKTLIDVSVPENVLNAFVAVVKLTNRGLFPSVNFVLKNNSDLFMIDVKTGEIRVRKYLDYETKTKHELFVGTSESDYKNQGTFVIIKVHVEDRNDVAPIFLTAPEPVSVTDDQMVGSIITSLNAVDTDSAGSPGSIVRYEMIGKEKALKYFTIDSENGNIKIKDDLRKETTIKQYEINVRAYDLGEPQLSSMANLLVFVKHIPLNGTTTRTTEIDEDLSLAFGDETYVTNIPESTNINAIIKLMPILNAKKSSKINFACEIIAGNDMNLFTTTIEDLACAVKLRDNVDYENETSHELSIKLHSSKQRVNSLKNSAVLKILIQDVNDNPPLFKFRQSNIQKRFPMRSNSYYGIVNYDSSIGTNVIKVEAYDEDSSTFGLIKFKLVDEKSEVAHRSEDLPSSYFIITETGMIRTRKPLYKIAKKQFSFKVEAADNYGRDNGLTHKTYARIVINVLSDSNLLTLAITDIAPEDVKKHKNKLEEIMSEKSNENMVQIEKFSHRKAMLSNGTIIELKDSTDVWFYVLNPKTETIILRNETQMMTSQIITIISRLLHSQVEGIFAPLEMENEILHLEISNTQNDTQQRLDYSLITAVAVVSLILIIGIAYLLMWWKSSYQLQNSTGEQPAANNQPISSAHSSVYLIDNDKRANVQVNLKELIVAYNGSVR